MANDVMVVDRKSLYRLIRNLNDESDGKEQKRDLVAGFYEAAMPAAMEARASILSMPSKGYAHMFIRAAIASEVDVDVRLSGRAAGVSVVARATATRGFWSAPRRFNREAPWNHPFMGRGSYEQRTKKAGWFDKPLNEAVAEVQARLGEVADNIVNRIARGVR